MKAMVKGKGAVCVLRYHGGNQDSTRQRALAALWTCSLVLKTYLLLWRGAGAPDENMKIKCTW